MEAQCDMRPMHFYGNCFFTWTFNILYFSDTVHCKVIILFPKSEKKRIFWVFHLTYSKVRDQMELHPLSKTCVRFLLTLPSFQGQTCAGKIICLGTSNLSSVLIKPKAFKSATYMVTGYSEFWTLLITVRFDGSLIYCCYSPWVTSRPA